MDNPADLQALLRSMADTGIRDYGTDARAVKLDNNSDVLRFAAKQHDATKGSPFDTVHFATGALTPRAAQALEAFLRGPARHLELKHLVIDNPESLLGSCPGLTAAFAGLTDLSHLELLSAGQHSRELLRDMKAKLTTVNLVMVPVEDDLDEEDAAWQATGRNPITLLTNFQDTLESLTGERTETLCVEELSYPQRYPNVSEIFLEDVDLPITVHYAHAYPNLSALKIRTDIEDFVELLKDERNAPVLRRQQNIVEQLAHGCWPSLSYCDSTLGTLYILGLQCHVHDLRILADIAGPGMLKSVLMDTRPTVLTLHQFTLDMLSDSDFTSLMRGSGVRQLKTLEITLVLNEHSGKGVGIAAAFNAMISALEPLKITAFGLTLACNFPGPYLREARGPAPRIFLTPEEEFLRDLQLDELAEKILSTVGSLQSVVVMMIAHRTRSPAAAALGQIIGTELRTYTMAKAYGLLHGTVSG